MSQLPDSSGASELLLSQNPSQRPSSALGVRPASRLARPASAPIPSPSPVPRMMEHGPASSAGQDNDQYGTGGHVGPQEQGTGVLWGWEPGMTFPPIPPISSSGLQSDASRATNDVTQEEDEAEPTETITQGGINVSLDGIWRILPKAVSSHELRFLFDGKEDSQADLDPLVQTLSTILAPAIPVTILDSGAPTAFPMLRAPTAVPMLPASDTCVALFITIDTDSNIGNLVSFIERLPLIHYPARDALLSQLLEDIASTDSSSSQALKFLLEFAGGTHCIATSQVPRRMNEPHWMDGLNGFRELGLLGTTTNVAIPPAKLSDERTRALDSQMLPVSTKLYVIYVYPKIRPSFRITPMIGITPVAPTSVPVLPPTTQSPSTVLSQHLVRDFPRETQRIRDSFSQNHYGKGYQQYVVVEQVRNIALRLNFNWPPTGQTASSIVETPYGTLTLNRIFSALVDGGVYGERASPSSFHNMRTTWKLSQTVFDGIKAQQHLLRDDDSHRRWQMVLQLHQEVGGKTAEVARLMTHPGYRQPEAELDIKTLGPGQVKSDLTSLDALLPKRERQRS